MRLPHAFWFLVLLAPQLCLAASVSLRGQALQEQLRADVADDRLDDFDEVSAALVCSGVHDIDQLERYRRRLLEECGQLGADSLPPEQPAAALFQFLHRELLTGDYHVEYTQLNRTLDEGHYNCVSSTILYYWLCVQAHLSPSIVATREHVYIKLPGTPPQEVETTSPVGFDRPSQAAKDPTLREINFLQLLGKVLYNRALLELREQRFASGVRLLETSLEFDSQDQSARENLLAALNNWALEQAATGNYAEAAALLRRGRSIDDRYQPIRTNDRHLQHTWARALCQRSRFSDALQRLETAARSHGDPREFRQSRMEVYHDWAASLFAENRTDEGYRVLEIGGREFAGDERWSSYEAAALGTMGSAADLTSPGS